MDTWQVGIGVELVLVNLKLRKLKNMPKKKKNKNKSSNKKLCEKFGLVPNLICKFYIFLNKNLK